MSVTIATARNAVRHRLRDGVPVLDATPVPFSTVRLEELTDQIPAAPTPTQTVFQVRFAGVPTQQYLNPNVCPQTLVAFVDGVWAPTHPTVDVDSNGNFTLPVPPVNRLLITYAWQYFSDGEIDAFTTEGVQWLRFADISAIPDGLIPALTSYAAAHALYALARSATIANIRAGEASVDWSALAAAYTKQAADLEAAASKEWEIFYSQWPQSLDPTAVDVSAARYPPYTPLR